MRHTALTRALWLLLASTLFIPIVAAPRLPHVRSEYPAAPVSGTPGVVDFRAHMPFTVLDTSGANLVCSSSVAGRTFPPMIQEVAQ